MIARLDIREKVVFAVYFPTVAAYAHFTPRLACPIPCGEHPEDRRAKVPAELD